MAKTGTVTVTSGKQDLVTATDADVLSLLQQEAGAGNSTAASDNVLPWLRVLQKNSPQVNKKDPAYINGAEAGMILNTSTNTLYDAENAGVRIIPCAYKAVWVEWEPRQGGGTAKPPVATHEWESGIDRRGKRNDRNVLVLPNGNELLETGMHFVLMYDTLAPGVLAMAKSAWQASRRWMTLRNSLKLPNGATYPAFGRSYLMKTKWAQNDKGDWYNYEFEDQGPLTEMEKIVAGKTLFEAWKKGELKTGDMVDSEAAPTSEVDDGIPI